MERSEKQNSDRELLEDIHEKVIRLDYTVHGNGVKGLARRVDDLESSMSAQKPTLQFADRMESIFLWIIRISAVGIGLWLLRIMMKFPESSGVIR